MTQTHGETAIPAESPDIPTRLHVLAARLMSMEAAGYDKYDIEDTRVLGVTELIAELHDQEIVKKRDALWGSITSYLQIGEPYSAGYSHSTLRAEWRFDLFKPVSFEQPVEAHLGDSEPSAQSMKLRAAVYAGDSAFQDDLSRSLHYVQNEPVFKARQLPEPILGIEAAKVGRNKFAFDRRELGIRIGESILERIWKLDATAYTEPIDNASDWHVFKSGTVNRYDIGSSGIDDTARYLRLQPHDVAFSSEGIVDNLRRLAQNHQAHTPQAIYELFYKKFVKPDEQKLLFMQFVADWLHQDMVMPLTAENFVTSTGR